MRRTAIRAKTSIPADIWMSRILSLCGSVLGTATAEKKPMLKRATISTAISQCSMTSSG